MQDFLNKFPKKSILWGGTGQAKVVRPIIEYYNAKIVAVFDDTPGLKSPFRDVEIYHGWEQFMNWLSKQKPEEIGFCVTIGNPNGIARIKFHERLINEGLKPISLAHPSAIIANSVIIGEGAQILAGAIIQPEAIIGKQCIINTKASVDHECILEDGVEIAPGATVCGEVKIGLNSWICSGATVLPRVKIGRNAIVGAGAVVIRDVPDGETVIGVPASPMKRK